MIHRRKGLIVGNDQEGDDCVLTAHVRTTCSLLFVSSTHPPEHIFLLLNGISKLYTYALFENLVYNCVLSQFQVPLNNMFGYSTSLRSMTQVMQLIVCSKNLN